MIDAKFKSYRMYYDDGDFRYVCLDPWKFTDYAFKLFLDHPEHLNGSIIYALGSICDEAASELTEVGLADAYPSVP